MISAEQEKPSKVSGVCYLSGLPAHMSVTQVKGLLQPYGIDRVYFKPRQQGKSRSYSEGWVEFKDQKIAKMCALSLNGTPIIQKKHKQLSDYTWQIKYLKGFKWEDLNENFNYERKINKKKLDMELNQAKKVHDFYLEKTIKKIYLPNYQLKNHQLEQKFNPSLSLDGKSCTPPQLIEVGKPENDQINIEQLVITNLESESIKIRDVKQKTNTEQILVETYVMGSKQIPSNGQGKIELVQSCPIPEDINQENYWTFIFVDIEFEDDSILSFGFLFTCDNSYRVVTFDWSLLILIVISICLMGVLAKFGRINSFSIKHNDQYFQGFSLNWKVLVIYILLYTIGYTLLQTATFQEGIRYSLIALTYFVGYFCAVFIIDEILCLTPNGSIWKSKIISVFRICDLVSFLLASAIIIPYFFTKIWYLSDAISVCMMGALVKLFKLNNLKDSFIFMIPCMMIDSIISTIIHYVDTESYNVLTLRYLNCPLELQLPLITLQFNRNCAWISLFSIVIPGLFLGMNYRFDQNKKTLSYAITSFSSLMFGQMIWLFSTIYQTHSWPSSIFTFSAMLIGTSLIALKRAEFQSFWDGNFFDEYLEKNYRIQSMFNQVEPQDGSLTMKLMEGLDRIPGEESRQQSVDL